MSTFTSVVPRPATEADADEVVRLRVLMMTSMGLDAGAPEWRTACAAELRRRIADETAVAFVVDRVAGVSRPLAASGIGVVLQGLPNPTQLSGRMGMIQGVCTEPEFRRRGYAAAITESLVRWFAARGVHRVDLFASEEGASVYRRLGFTDPPHPLLVWRHPGSSPAH